MLKNVARGAALRSLSDITLAYPLEIWKNSVIITWRSPVSDGEKRPSDLKILNKLFQERGLAGFWRGCTARLLEASLSGGMVLASTECTRKLLLASGIPIAMVAFLAGALGGASQAIVMTPSTLFITTSTAMDCSMAQAAAQAWKRKGLRGIYAGAGAIALRQASNWASRQGFTQLARPMFGDNLRGELLAGCVGGCLSCWNTPLEVARVEAQSFAFSDEKKDGRRGVFVAMASVLDDRGVGGLFAGVTPRMIQACYQTIFLVSIPKLLSV